MEAYTGFAYVYDEYMDNIPYDEWEEYLVELLKENGIDKDNTVIDLGCGTGTVTRMLDKEGYNCIGIDLSEDMLSIAIALGPSRTSAIGSNSVPAIALFTKVFL